MEGDAAIRRATEEASEWLLASSDIHPENFLPEGHWQAVEDFHMPHGNSMWADELRVPLQRIKASTAFAANLDLY